MRALTAVQHSKSPSGAARQIAPPHRWIKLTVSGLCTGCTVAGAALIISSGTVQGAETVNYTGAGGLQPDPLTANASVGPSGIDDIPDGAASVSGNSVGVQYTPDGSNDITGSVYGAFRWDSTTVNENTVFLINGSVAHHLFGGYSRFGMAEENGVVVTGGTVGEHVFGGWSVSGAVTRNTVALTSADVAHDIFGGYSGNGAANLNGVVVYSGTVGEYIYGGRSDNSTATQNYVVTLGGTVGIGVFGGYSDTGAEANIVNMNSGTVNAFVIGGYSNSGYATGNSVIIELGTVGTEVSGGSIATGTSSRNTVIMSGGAVGESVYGGWSSNGNAENNRAELRGGTVAWGLHGGYGQGGAASGNTVLVSGGSVGLDVVGGTATGGSASDNATANSVIIHGGLADRHVIGGYANFGDATGNAVLIEGGAISESIFGGYVYQGSGNATGNTVTLAGSPTFGVSSRIMGGETIGSSGDMRTGNTLNVLTSGLAVAEVNNFSNYNFFLPANLISGGAVITITGSTPTDLNGANTLVSGIADGSPLLQGNSVILISNTINSPVNNNQIQEIQVGIVRLYDLKVYDQAGTLYAEIVSIDELTPADPDTPVNQDVTDHPSSSPSTPVQPRLNPQTASFPEGRAAGLALINHGGDLLQGSGLDALGQATRQTGIAAFGSTAAAGWRSETGSHVDIDGISLLAGLGKGLDLGSDRASLGLFLEAGTGGYDAYNSVVSGDVRADGNSDFFGVGLIGRYDSSSGWHAETGLRTGQSNTDYDSDDITLNGRSASFSTSAWYAGGHLGAGHIWQTGQGSEFDLYSKLLYSHLDGDDITILGDPVQFNNSDSLRWRTGIRFETTLAERFMPYMGAAYEHEFDGKIEATAYNMSIDAPSLKGDSGIGELGLRAENLLESKSLSLDLGIQGFVGQREGLGVHCQLRWLF